jgi:DNA-directed RNA polymerase specialized sigma24 family protein
MPNTNAYVRADGPPGIPGREGITEAFMHILSRRLVSFYRKAYRMLGNRADAEDAVSTCTTKTQEVARSWPERALHQ